MFGIDTFANPGLLWLLLLIVPVIVWYIIKLNNREPELKTSGLKAFSEHKPSLRTAMRHIMFVFRMLAVALMIIALARPQAKNSWRKEDSKGIDIMLSLDISKSMLAEDFTPNRLQAAEDVALDFIADRQNDRMGLVVFAGESFTQCPLTTNHNELTRLFNNVNSDMLSDGTAIGSGLATAVNRLKDSKAASKVVILLTDGVNNSGSVSPATAAEIAKTYNIRVYTIGVGSKGKARYPVQTPFGKQYQQVEVNIDEDILKEIAEMTGGKYFRATDNQKLKSIYKEIDKLEKTIIKEKKYTNTEEKFYWFLLISVILLLIENVLRYTIFKQIP